MLSKIDEKGTSWTPDLLMSSAVRWPSAATGHIRPTMRDTLAFRKSSADDLSWACFDDADVRPSVALLLTGVEVSRKSVKVHVKAWCGVAHCARSLPHSITLKSYTPAVKMFCCNPV
jgi:hypothetical protein